MPTRNRHVPKTGMFIQRFVTTQVFNPWSFVFRRQPLEKKTLPMNSYCSHHQRIFPGKLQHFQWFRELDLAIWMLRIAGRERFSLSFTRDLDWLPVAVQGRPAWHPAIKSWGRWDDIWPLKEASNRKKETQTILGLSPTWAMSVKRVIWLNISEV